MFPYKIIVAILISAAVGVSCMSVDDLKKACDGGEAEACEKACEKGVAGKGGCLSAGTAHAEGQGIPKNTKRAVHFFVLACGGGDTDGCFRAGQGYQKGLGVERDAKRALALYEQGCTKDSAASCDEAARYHEADERWDKARELYAKACTLRGFTACSNADKLDEIRARRERMKQETASEAAGRGRRTLTNDRERRLYLDEVLAGAAVLDRAFGAPLDAGVDTNDDRE